MAENCLCWDDYLGRRWAPLLRGLGIRWPHAIPMIIRSQHYMTEREDCTRMNRIRERRDNPVAPLGIPKSSAISSKHITVLFEWFSPVKSREGAESLVRINVVRTEAAQRQARPGTEEARGPRPPHLAATSMMSSASTSFRISSFQDSPQIGRK